MTSLTLIRRIGARPFGALFGGRPSLARRLVLLATIWSVAVLVATGVALTALFHQDAVSRFDDPSVPFNLQFMVPEAKPAAVAEPAAPPPEPKPEAAGDQPKVVSLDQFRKK